MRYAEESEVYIKGDDDIIYKMYNANDLDFYKPRGHMFTLSTLNGVDYNFGGLDTGTYPASGVNLLWGGASAPGHGVHVVPKANQVMYLSGMKLFFNHTAKSLFAEAYKDRVDDAEETLEFMHSDSAYCDCAAPICITTISEQAPIEIDDMLAVNQHFYSQSFPIECPGRFDGDEGESFGVRASGGNGLYLGTSFAANKLTHLHFQFTGWVVDKVLIDGTYYEVIPI